MERNGNEQRGEKRRGRRWGEEGRGNSSGKRVEAVPRRLKKDVVASSSRKKKKGGVGENETLAYYTVLYR